MIFICDFLLSYLFVTFSASKLRDLDASGPPGHPALFLNDGTANTGGISALAFSEDGEVSISEYELLCLHYALQQYL